MKPVLNFLVPRLCYFLVLVLRWSYRVRVVGAQHLSDAQQQHVRKSVVFACWHEHLLGVLCTQRGLHTIISRNQMGQVLAYACRKSGYQIYFGSANRGQDRGGLAALLGMSRALKHGARGCVTVDGSIGPRRVAKQGVLELARQSSARIVPLAVAADRYWEFNTWDRLKLPKPFARLVVSFGMPLASPQRGSECYEQAARELAAAIDASELVACAQL